MKPSRDFTSRLNAARKIRREIEPYIKEALSFCAPGREKDFDNRRKREHEEAENLHSLGEELTSDLSTDLVSYYFPDEQRWASYDYTIEVPEDQQAQVQAEVQAREDASFTLLESSNFNEIKASVMLEAAIHGTPAMWVDIAHTTRPVHCQVVPPSELLLVPGHLGYLDRFRETTVPARTVDALFAQDQVTIPKEIREKQKKTDATLKVCWGYWLDWSDPGNPQWLREITLDGKRISQESERIGPMAGACPLLVGRFNAWPGRAWGRGAGLKALPDLRLLNRLDEVILEGLDQSLTNTMIYPDDGFLDLSEGLTAGVAHPAGRGFNRNSIYEVPTGTNLDLGYFTEERIEERLRVAFFQDGPRQRGDTPPSATQWSDQRRMAQRRLGRPSATIFSELGADLIKRIEHIGVQIGRLPDAITHAGDVISLTPISPLQIAADLDKVVTTRSNLDLGMQTFGPEALGQYVDIPGTLTNVIKATGDDLIVLQSPEDNTDDPTTTGSGQGPAA
ncbi:hypothetical protein JANAI62_03770 [Jannaschia pagri]|uniref:Uncharacterized protein n=1 Tax=Jannaschia pagri TaxID=2829797 RepID=A0ABQ4NH44_9RHOB|nr:MULTISPECIES: portal protein [unclassified Jannaschia]GIT90140.1 hypothetical protein JANAI61_05980 [Jannaschia sp. AI_61]GIT93754.1 hypothetical protein JANAI62_03770 [Jannaschia sp. AI_62]